MLNINYKKIRYFSIIVTTENYCICCDIISIIMTTYILNSCTNNNINKIDYYYIYLLINI